MSSLSPCSRLSTSQLPRWSKSWLVAIGACCSLTHASERYEGRAYARTDGRVLYLETHWRYQEEGVWQHLVLYSCPDGASFARKRLRELPDSITPVFDFEDGRDGYREGVRGQGSRREVYVQADRTSPLVVKEVQIPNGAVIDAGFDALVRGSWGSLSAGTALNVPFLIPSRFAYIDFKITDARDGMADGRLVRRLRMKLSAWYGFAVPAIELAYERDGSRLVEFQGMGTVRDGQGRHQDVRIVFAAINRRESPPSTEIAHAATRPLVRQCPGERP